MKQLQFNLGLTKLAFGLAICFLMVSSALSQSVPGCGTLRSALQYGPYDARTDLDKLPIVLGAHFPVAVEALISGTSQKYPGGDIDYTLRAIPNYHRALIAMMKLGEKSNSDQPRDVRYSVDCWFLRAIAFRADDTAVRMIYSTYLNSKKRITEAKNQLQIATGFAKDNGFTHYNIGLHYLDLKDYEQALTQAHKATELGFIQTELKDQLVSAGKWREAVISAPEVASPPAATSDAATTPANSSK